NQTSGSYVLAHSVAELGAGHTLSVRAVNGAGLAGGQPVQGPLDRPIAGVPSGQGPIGPRVRPNDWLDRLQLQAKTGRLMDQSVMLPAPQLLGIPDITCLTDHKLGAGGSGRSHAPIPTGMPKP